jgi:hypothetical protein
MSVVIMSSLLLIFRVHRDSEQELTDLERDILHLGGNNKASHSRQEEVDFVEPCTPSPSRKRSLSHEERDTSKGFGTGGTYHQSEADILPSHKKKLRRLTHKILRSDTAYAPSSITKVSDKRKKPCPPRAPADELVLVRDLAVSALGVDPQCGSFYPQRKLASFATVC